MSDVALNICWLSCPVGQHTQFVIVLLWILTLCHLYSTTDINTVCGLCITVTMHIHCAQLSLCIQSVHKCHYAYRLCTTVIMRTDCAQLSLCVHTVHNCHYVYRLWTNVIMRTDCAHLSLCIQTVQNCHYAYSLCTTVTMCTDRAQLSLYVHTVRNCHYAYISFICLPHCCEVISSLTQNISSHNHLFGDS